MDLSPKAILRIAKDYGWELKRVTGSHHIYKNPTTGKSVPIPIHGNKDLKLGTFKSIEKILKENEYYFPLQFQNFSVYSSYNQSFTPPLYNNHDHQNTPQIQDLPHRRGRQASYGAAGSEKQGHQRIVGRLDGRTGRHHDCDGKRQGGHDGLGNSKSKNFSRSADEMSYKIKFHKAADKEIAKLSPALQLEVLRIVDELVKNPRPHGYKKMSAYKSERVPNKTCYRVKATKDYRIIYTIEQEIITITIVKVKHRKEVYKK